RTYVSARGKTAVIHAAPRLTGLRAAVATLVCAIPLAVGCVVPVLLLLRLLLGETDVALTSRYFAWSFNSLRVATLAALLAVILAIVMVYAIRLAPGAVTRLGS